MKSASLLCIAVFLGLVMAKLDWAARIGLGAAHSGGSGELGQRALVSARRTVAAAVSLGSTG